MVGPLHLTTGDILDAGAARPPRRSLDYIARFAKRIPPMRAIRMKCATCMGGDADRMPRGEVAQAIDECSSTGCPLWPFRYGTDPWRPEPTDAQRATGREAIARARTRLEKAQTASAQKADDAPTGTQTAPVPAALAGAATPRAL